MCRNPTSFDARVVSTNASFDTVDQVLQVNLTHGISCINSDNTGDCLDYKIRFCCPTRECSVFVSSSNIQDLVQQIWLEISDETVAFVVHIETKVAKEKGRIFNDQKGVSLRENVFHHNKATSHSGVARGVINKLKNALMQTFYLCSYSSTGNYSPISSSIIFEFYFYWQQ